MAEDLKLTVAANITALRTLHKMTQLELAEKLSYSDKSVSKWERGESIPDVIVLKQIADMYGVTLDWMVSEHTDKEIEISAPKEDGASKNQRIIELVSVLGTLILAIIVFTIVWICGGKSWAWSVFIAALPVVAVLLIVLSAIWERRKQICISVSMLIWTLLLTIHLTVLAASGPNLWMLYLIGPPAQIITVLSFGFRKSGKR